MRAGGRGEAIRLVAAQIWPLDRSCRAHEDRGRGPGIYTSSFAYSFILVHGTQLVDIQRGRSKRGGNIDPSEGRPGPSNARLWGKARRRVYNSGWTERINGQAACSGPGGNEYACGRLVVAQL